PSEVTRTSAPSNLEERVRKVFFMIERSIPSLARNRSVTAGVLALKVQQLHIHVRHAIFSTLFVTINSMDRAKIQICGPPAYVSALLSPFHGRVAEMEPDEDARIRVFVCSLGKSGV